MTRLANGYGRHKKNITITTLGYHPVAKIGLGKKNLTTLISLSDIDVLNDHSFYADKREDGQYVARSSTTGEYLHRILVPSQYCPEVDHVDANPLNNMRGNLRPCSTRQNNLAKKAEKVRGYYGIHRMKWGWFKAVTPEGKKVGRYDTGAEAARARDELMVDYYFDSYCDEELHPYGFINWNFPFDVPHENQVFESDCYLHNQEWDAIRASLRLLNEKGWKCQ